MTRVHLTLVSGNSKTGKIPVSTSSRDTCPPSCPHYEQSCYAKHHKLGLHWAKVTEKKRGTEDWLAFCSSVAGFKPGQVWRHNQAGDLPGAGESIDALQLDMLAIANAGRRGFTYTHKPVLDDAANALAVKRANASGFTVNLSADSLEQADAYAELGIGPVVTTLPSDAPRGLKTPSGRHIVICPAQERDDVTCASCKLCTVASRKSIVGFKAHGIGARRVDQRWSETPKGACNVQTA